MCVIRQRDCRRRPLSESRQRTCGGGTDRSDCAIAKALYAGRSPTRWGRSPLPRQPRSVHAEAERRELMMAIPMDRMKNNQDMQTWEYTTFDLAKPKTDVDGLNRLGRKGWEAVSMVSSWGVGWRFVHPIVLLRRPLPDDAR